ncbi:MAG: hypothetical protein JEZ09_00320 [Salinivirgaceae bacterium]|nr:hypothetical protein [Salinivirgaceae bacterium]
MKILSKIPVGCVLIVIFFIISFCSFGQTEPKTYDKNNDTLLIMSNKLIDQDKILLERKFLMNSDSIKINQKGLTIKEFTVSSLALGKDISIKSDKPFITESIKDQIINEQNKYKFIYIKNIVLQTKDGRTLSPSTKSIKIVFIN